MRKAIVNSQGDVTNVVEVAPDSDWEPPLGSTLVDVSENEVVSPGDRYEDGEFILNESNYAPRDPLLEEA